MQQQQLHPGYILFYCVSPKGPWHHNIVTIGKLNDRCFCYFTAAILREWKTAETWFLARLFIYQSSIVSQTFDHFSFNGYDSYLARKLGVTGKLTKTTVKITCDILSHLAYFMRTRANAVFLQQLQEGNVNLFHPKMKKKTKNRRKQ